MATSHIQILKIPVVLTNSGYSLTWFSVQKNSSIVGHSGGALPWQFQYIHSLQSGIELNYYNVVHLQTVGVTLIP